MNKVVNILLFGLGSFLFSCGGSSIPSNPIKEMSIEFENKYAYSILLKDMDLKENQYLHKYTIVDIQKNNQVSINESEWKKVDDNFFYLHEDDLGMEVLSKKRDGKLNNLVTPPGFSNFVDNKEYGSWEIDDNSNQVWVFKPEYVDLENKLGLTDLRVTNEEFVEYKSKFLYNRPYYGPKTGTSDSTKYGTRSSHWFIMYPMFYNRRIKTKNFSKPKSIFNTNSNRGGGGFGK